jgi:hypothetical protein
MVFKAFDQKGFFCPKIIWVEAFNPSLCCDKSGWPSRRCVSTFYKQNYQKQVAYEVNSLPADFLAIATQELVNSKYWGSQILLCAYPAQRGIEQGYAA